QPAAQDEGHRGSPFFRVFSKAHLQAYGAGEHDGTAQDELKRSHPARWRDGLGALAAGTRWRPAAGIFRWLQRPRYWRPSTRKPVWPPTTIAANVRKEPSARVDTPVMACPTVQPAAMRPPMPIRVAPNRLRSVSRPSEKVAI